VVLPERRRLKPKVARTTTEAAADELLAVRSVAASPTPSWVKLGPAMKAWVSAVPWWIWAILALVALFAAWVLFGLGTGSESDVADAAIVVS
jgi:type VI protein secretion system component VasF